MSTAQMESKLLGHHPLVQSLLVDVLGDLTFSGHVFIRLYVLILERIVQRLFDAILRSNMNIKGAVLMDKDIRSLQRVMDDYLHTKAKRLYYEHHGKTRACFEKLMECSILVNGSTVEELKQLMEDPSYQWHLSVDEMKRIVRLRKDLVVGDVLK